jgi:hypothetical protein
VVCCNTGRRFGQSPDAGVNVAGGVAVNLVVSSGSGSSGGGGSMEPFTLVALVTLLVVGWRRARSAFLVSLSDSQEHCRPSTPWRGSNLTMDWQ